MAEHDQALLIAYYKNPSLALKNDILDAHQGIVNHLARKMAFDRTHLEDITQIANIGLLKAIERFDPNQSNNFVGFAIPTIVGEIKHYLRDSMAMIRIPRTVQENDLRIRRFVKEHTQNTGKSPTPRAIAEALELSVESVLECSEINSFTRVSSLDKSLHDETGPSLLETVACERFPNGKAEDYSDIQAALETLDDRTKTIVKHRFYDGWTQQEIAESLGLSQMHVSRLLRAGINQLKAALES
ncbi:MAG: hypothetical protein CMJ93_02545 [Planctomycetes bacterium]|nr:hypothetical protein [Planctomycetota bacterium]